MKAINYSWEQLFSIFSLLLLVAIPFGYFWGSLAFGFWFAICALWGMSKRHFKFKPLLFPLLLFSLFSFVTILWTQDIDRTTHAISRQMPLLLFPIAGMCIPNISKEQIVKIMKRYAIFLCIFFLVLLSLAIFKYLKYEYRDFLFYHELVSPLELNAIYVSYIVSTFFLFYLIQEKKFQISSILILLVLGVFLLMLSSKMVIFITSLIVLGILGLKLKTRKQRFFGLAMIILFSFVTLKFAKPIQKRFNTEFNTSFEEILNAPSFEKGRAYTGLEARVLQVRVFNEIVDTPLEYVFGVGLAATNNQITQIHQRLNTPEAFHDYNFHNQYLQAFAELGIIGLILLLWVLWTALRLSFKHKMLLPFVIVTMALFFSESVIWRQRGILFFGILYIFLILSNQIHESQKQLR